LVGARPLTKWFCAEEKLTKSFWRCQKGLAAPPY